MDIIDAVIDAAERSRSLSRWRLRRWQGKSYPCCDFQKRHLPFMTVSVMLRGRSSGIPEFMSK